MKTSDNQTWSGFEFTSEDVGIVLKAHGLIEDELDNPEAERHLRLFTLADCKRACAGAEGDVDEMTEAVHSGIEDVLMEKGVIVSAKKF